MKDILFTALAWLLTLPFLLLTVGFALYNQTEVDVVASPFVDAHRLPLYVPTLVALAIGFVFGSVMTWAAMGRQRHQRRQQARKIRTLETQLDVVAAQPVIPGNYLTAPLPPVHKVQS